MRDETVLAWAQRNGVLNGADLLSVMQMMQTSGFQQDGTTYGDGEPQSVDFTQEQSIRNAVAMGPVKIAIDANALPSGAGNEQGWYAFGGSRYGNTDHCVEICGYGTASQMFAAIGKPVPGGVDTNKTCFLLFTWSTIGVVDFAWIGNTCTEAWIRVPNTTWSPPRPTPPGPTPPPPAPVPPTPIPVPSTNGYDVNLTVPLGPIAITITGTVTPQSGFAGSRNNSPGMSPIVLAILKALCAEAPYLPAPWSTVAQLACGLLPPRAGAIPVAGLYKSPPCPR